MNELNFNSQVCTTIEQSQRLLDLGLKPETADMSHQYTEAEWSWFIFPCNWNRCAISEELIPAWSLHRLLCMLDYDNADTFNIMPNLAYEDVISTISLRINCGVFNREYLKQ